MEMLGIICNNYECNGSIQINFEWEIENYFGSQEKNKKFIFFIFSFSGKYVFDENKFIMLCDIVVIKI